MFAPLLHCHSLWPSPTPLLRSVVAHRVPDTPLTLPSPTWPCHHLFFNYSRRQVLASNVAPLRLIKPFFFFRFPPPMSQSVSWWCMDCNLRNRVTQQLGYQHGIKAYRVPYSRATNWCTFSAFILGNLRFRTISHDSCFSLFRLRNPNITLPIAAYQLDFTTVRDLHSIQLQPTVTSSHRTGCFKTQAYSSTLV